MSQERLLSASDNDTQDATTSDDVEPYWILSGLTKADNHKPVSRIKKIVAVVGMCALVLFAGLLGYLAGRQHSDETKFAAIDPQQTNRSHPTVTSPVDQPVCSTSAAYNTPNQTCWKDVDDARYSSAVNRTKPDVKVYALVFYGRRRFVDILDCYLRKNLVKNGGFIDEVIFGMNTNDAEDIAWLKNLVKEEDVKQYYKIRRKKPGLKWAFRKLWDFADDEEAIYLKLDDDLIWIHDDAIPRMVHTLIAHPEAHNIQANIINHLRTPFMHYRTDAMHAFLPGRIYNHSQNQEPVNDWRVSSMPYYKGVPPEPFVEAIDDISSSRQWFRMEDTAANMVRTPLAGLTHEADTQLIQHHSWAVAAQIHYSHLLNVEEGHKMSNYWFGDKEGIWNLWYARYSINFMAIRGDTIAKLSPSSWTETEEASNTLDEILMTVKFPRELDMPAKVDTHALAAHFSYHQTREDLETTDILDRYRAYANEFVCSSSNTKSPFPEDVY